MCKEVEVMWFIHGIWIGNTFYGRKKFHSRGNEGSVDFEWKKGNGPFVLGWIHTHPSNFGCGPSATDDKTMRSWVRGKGRPMICGIICDKEEVWYLYYRDVGVIWRATLEINFSGDFVWGSRKETLGIPV